MLEKKSALMEPCPRQSRKLALVDWRGRGGSWSSSACNIGLLGLQIALTMAVRLTLEGFYEVGLCR